MQVLSVPGEKSVEETDVIFLCAGCTVKPMSTRQQQFSRGRNSCSLPTLKQCTEPPDKDSQVKLL
jgi:hypothetical protein